MPMARQTLADDAPLQNGKRGKQRGRPVPLVVVRHRGAAKPNQGQLDRGTLRSAPSVQFVSNFYGSLRKTP